jgi:hypothetical protein
VAFLASSAGLEHEAQAHRSGCATGCEIDCGSIESGCAEVDLLDLNLHKSAFVEQGFHAKTPAGPRDVFGQFCGTRINCFSIFKTQFEVG